MPDKSNSREQGSMLAHSVRTQSIMARKPGQQKHEAAGHSTSHPGSRVVNAGFGCSPLPIQPRTPTPGIAPSTFRTDHPTPVNQSRQSLISGAEVCLQGNFRACQVGNHYYPS